MLDHRSRLSLLGLHSVPPISGEGKVGDLLSTISTQPRTNTVERRVKRCAMLASMAWPVCMARHLANFLIWSTATGCQPGENDFFR